MKTFIKNLCVQWLLLMVPLMAMADTSAYSWYNIPTWQFHDLYDPIRLTNQYVYVIYDSFMASRSDGRPFMYVEKGDTAILKLEYHAKVELYNNSSSAPAIRIAPGAHLIIMGDSTTSLTLVGGSAENGSAGSKGKNADTGDGGG